MIKGALTMAAAATLLTIRIPAFDAAIRKVVDKRLSSCPVVVVTSFKRLGRVVAACPDARAHGIVEEMHFPEARLRCSDAAFYLPDKCLSDRMMRALLAGAGKYSPLVEAAGDGCIVLDIRGTERLWGDNCRVADMLRRDVMDRLCLPAMAGLAVYRPWSLLASRAAGDAGVCHVPPGLEESFLGQVPVAWIDGLTPRTRTLLAEMNIRTLGQIRGFNRSELLRQFGRACGDILWNTMHPEAWDTIPLLSEDTLLDMSANGIRVEAALAEASVAEEKLRLVVRTLAARIAVSLRARKLGAARLRLALLHADGALKTVETRTGGFIQEEAMLQAAAGRLLARAFVRRVRVIRLWLEAEKLSEPECQGALFPADAEMGAKTSLATARHDAEKLLAAVDGIRKRYGDEAVRPAALLGKKRAAQPGRLFFNPDRALPRNSA